MNLEYFSEFRAGFEVEFESSSGVYERGIIIEIRRSRFPFFMVVEYFIIQNERRARARQIIWPGDYVQILNSDANVPANAANRDDMTEANQSQDGSHLQTHGQLNQVGETMKVEQIPLHRRVNNAIKNACIKFKVIIYLGIIMSLFMGSIIIFQSNLEFH
jgi:hypothetical protein